MRAAAVGVAVAAAVVLTGCAGPGAERPATGTAGERGVAAPAAVAPTPPPEGARARGSGDWRIERQSRDHEVEAFTTRPSAEPGTPIGLKVSTTSATYRVAAYRIGSYPGGWGHLVWRSGPVAGRVQPAPVLAPVATRTVVAPWRRDLRIGTEGWEPGFYALKLRTQDGWETLVPYVVRSPDAEGAVALVAPVTTWQAYNEWGGYSLYDGPPDDRRSWAVSFDRPYNGATGANDYRTAAFPIVALAERLGIDLAYFTNVDLHLDPGALDGARGYVSLGHDEYWTNRMREAVEEARDAGTNLAFLGANTMYWRVRLADRATGPARVVVGYRSDAHLDPVEGAETTARFRDAPAPRPEHTLIGMQYECYPVDADYVVTSPGWWGFRGTGLDLGDRVPGLVGPEADRVYPDRLLPRPLEILSSSPYSCGGVPTTAQSVYYTDPSGAGVFTAGTLRWGCALQDRCEHPLGQPATRFVARVTENVLRGFAAGPVGRRHPARDNVARFDLPLENLVGAS